MKLTGWLVEKATQVPATPKAWFHLKAEAIEYQAKHGGVMREMNGEVQLAPAPSPAAEVLR